MQKVLQSLLELQKLDAELAGVRARLAACPQKLADADARVAAARAEVERSKAAQLAAAKDRKKYELDVEQWKERVRKYRDQTSLIKTNEAYTALQREVQLAETEIAKAEDRLLEQMVSADEYDRRIKTSQQTLKEVEEAMRRERSQIEVEKSAAEKAIAEMDAERARLVADVPEDLLAHYERIAKKHNGIALAEVRDENAPPAVCVSVRACFRNCAARAARRCFTARPALAFSIASSLPPRRMSPPPRPQHPLPPRPRPVPFRMNRNASMEKEALSSRTRSRFVGTVVRACPPRAGTRFFFKAAV